MQRLRKRQQQLNVTPADADIVLIGAGCTRAHQAFLAAEEAALREGRRASPALRVTAVGTSFAFLRDLRWAGSAEKCFEPEAVLSFSHIPSDNVNRW